MTQPLAARVLLIVAALVATLVATTAAVSLDQCPATENRGGIDSRVTQAPMTSLDLRVIGLNAPGRQLESLGVSAPTTQGETCAIDVPDTDLDCDTNQGACDCSSGLPLTSVFSTCSNIALATSPGGLTTFVADFDVVYSDEGETDPFGNARGRVRHRRKARTAVVTRTTLTATPGDDASSIMLAFSTKQGSENFLAPSINDYARMTVNVETTTPASFTALTVTNVEASNANVIVPINNIQVTSYCGTGLACDHTFTVDISVIGHVCNYNGNYLLTLEAQDGTTFHATFNIMNPTTSLAQCVEGAAIIPPYEGYMTRTSEETAFVTTADDTAVLSFESGMMNKSPLSGLVDSNLEIVYFGLSDAGVCDVNVPTLQVVYENGAKSSAGQALSGLTIQDDGQATITLTVAYSNIAELVPFGTAVDGDTTLGDQLANSYEAYPCFVAVHSVGFADGSTGRRLQTTAAAGVGMAAGTGTIRYVDDPSFDDFTHTGVRAGFSMTTMDSTMLDTESSAAKVRAAIEATTRNVAGAEAIILHDLKKQEPSRLRRLVASGYPTIVANVSLVLTATTQADVDFKVQAALQALRSDDIHVEFKKQLSQQSLNAVTSTAITADDTTSGTTTTDTPSCPGGQHCAATTPWTLILAVGGSVVGVALIVGGIVLHRRNK